VTKGFWSSAVFVVPLVAIWLVPVIAAVILIPTAGSSEAAALRSRQPTTVRVGSQLNAAKQEVNIVVSTTADIAVTASASGLVTAVSIAPGDRIASGTRLVSVDDVPILAYLAPAPLYRDLSTGDRGPDVRNVQQFLAKAGFAPGRTDGVFSTSTFQAVKRFEKAHGLQLDGVIHRDELAWAPPGLTAVGSVAVQVGERASEGTKLFAGSVVADSVEFQPSEGSGQSLSSLSSGKIRISVGSANVTVASLNPTTSERAALMAFLAKQATGQSLTAKSQGNKITYSGAVLSVADPQKLATAPSAAIYSGSIESCVFVVEGSHARAVVVSNPQLVPGSLDTVQISSSLAGKRVFEYPDALGSQVRSQCA
jgi:peptidoglycan hydrolase-like protein with peptidoglycan-binding domain